MGMFSTFPGMSGSSSDSCSHTHMQTLAPVRFVVCVCPEALRRALLHFLHFVTFFVLRRRILSVRTGVHRKSLCANKGGGEACTGVLAKTSVGSNIGSCSESHPAGMRKTLCSTGHPETGLRPEAMRPELCAGARRRWAGPVGNSLQSSHGQLVGLWDSGHLRGVTASRWVTMGTPSRGSPGAVGGADARYRAAGEGCGGAAGAEGHRICRTAGALH